MLYALTEQHFYLTVQCIRDQISTFMDTFYISCLQNKYYSVSSVLKKDFGLVLFECHDVTADCVHNATLTLSVAYYTIDYKIVSG